MSDNQNDHGSFSSGIIVGFLVGSAGYFLTQTKEGKELRSKFGSHWNDLKDSLIEDGVISESEAEITDYIQVIRKKISDFLGDNLQETTDKKNPRSKKSSKSKKTTKSRKKKLFKGI